MKPVPSFLGHPACYYGFALYLIIAVFAGLLVWKKIKEKFALNVVLVASLLGVLFAGYFSMGELPLLLKNGFGAYVFGLPTCMLGLVFFIAVFACSFWARLGQSQLRT